MINVQLEVDGPITSMDESLLEKREGIIENENEQTTWVEYWLPNTADRAVHRSVHITLKKGLAMLGEQGSIGG